jgi:2-polyprenyl-3-methyl-5-hydroxy-6-metoxy-1,4-benzoquinol methylase
VPAPFVERSLCPGCGGSVGATLFECSYADDPIHEVVRSAYPAMTDSEEAAIGSARYILDKCARCGLVWQRFAPNPELLGRLYEVWSEPEQLHERQDTLRHGQSYAQEVMLVLEHFGDPPRELSVLDFGSGWGRWPRMAAAFGCQAYGADLSSDQSAWAAAQGVTMIDPADLPSGLFHFINTEQVFEHLVDPAGTTRALAQALRPDGLLKISVPNAADLDRRLAHGRWDAPKHTKDSLNIVHPLEHLNAFTVRSLEAMTAEAGLRRVRMPLREQYAAATNWRPAREFLRNLAKPIVRNYGSRTYLFFSLDRA